MDQTELKQSFDHFDTDGNGTIEFDEFSQLLKALGSVMDQESLQIGFDAIDVDQNGHISFEEFSSWWTEQD